DFHVTGVQTCALPIFIRKLREAEAQLAAGATVAEVSKKLGVSENTYHRWRAQYGGMKADQAKRLKELEKENARLKRIVAEQAVEIGRASCRERVTLAG